jgi:hypothetical protein
VNEMEVRFNKEQTDCMVLGVISGIADAISVGYGKGSAIFLRDEGNYISIIAASYEGRPTDARGLFRNMDTAARDTFMSRMENCGMQGY